MQDGFWQRDTDLPQFPRLEGDLRTDILIIGGGMTGLLLAARLTAAGADCALIEKDRLMSGVSGRTTAKVTSQHGLCYGDLLRDLGQERAWLYWRANEDALAAYRALGEAYLQTQNNYVYATDGAQALTRELEACIQLKIPAQWVSSLPLPFPVAGAVMFSEQAQLHPLKLAAGLAKGLRIFENTKALEFVGNRVKTPGGSITAERIVVATHFPMLNKHGAYFLKLYQQRSYVIALKNAPPLEGMYLDCRENGLSLRSAGEYLLLGGGGHRTGKQGMGWHLSETAARTYYPRAREVCRWATQDCMSLDAMPYIGRYSKATPRLYVATGFNKWGMSGAMVAAKVLTEQLLGRDDPYGGLFSPSRPMLGKQLLINGMESAVNLLRPTTPRCPHLGCALIWNRQERSWDCPCHGSRFDPEGKLLNGPATDDLKRHKS